jgi:hypothetical protein
MPALAVHIAQRRVLLKSHATEHQLFEVVAGPYPAALIALAPLATAELVLIAERIAARRDPTDDKFLELAVNSGLSARRSASPDTIKSARPFRGIPIVPRASFVQGAPRPP